MEPFFIYILKSAGGLFLFFATYKLFLQKETFFNSNRLFLMLGLITSLIIPFVEFTKTIFIEALQTNNIPFIINNTPTEVIIENKVDWSAIIMLIYLLGVLFFSLRFVIQLLSLYKLIRNGNLDKKNGFKYIETKENTSPFSFFNYIVYNPEKHSEEEIKTIIEHEKIHSSQKHSIDIILAHLLSIFQWVNPIIWLYKKEIAQNLEYIADNESVKTVQHTKDYQYLLLKQSSSNCHLSITNTFFNLLIKKRIVMLNKNKSHKQNAWKYGLIIPLLIGFIISFNVKTVAQTITKASKRENIGFLIEKNTTNDYLDKITQEINQKNNGNLKFEKIKRNVQGDITNIKISYLNGEQQISNIFSEDSGISNFVIGYNDGKEVFIGSDQAYSNMSIKNEPPKVYTIPNNPTNEELENIVEKINIDNKSNPHNSFKIRIPSEGDPIYILDGKKIRKKEFEKLMLTPKKIEPMNILIGEKAIEKYGQEGKNGAYEITTKNSTNKVINYQTKKNKIRVVGYGDSISSTKLETKKSPWKVSAGVSSDLFGHIESTETIYNNGKPYLLEKVTNQFNQDPLFILDGKEITKKEFEKINPFNIHSIEALKGEETIKKYGDKASNGVIIIKLKNEDSEITTLKLESSALYIIDGKESSAKDLENIDPYNIKSIDVLKDEAATKKYGKKAKNGVIEIFTKK